MVKIAAPRLIEVTKVKVHPNNVKEHPEKQINNLIQLIKWVGFKDPIVLDKDNNCKAGHGRLLAAQKLGMKEVPYVLLDGLTKKQMDLFIYMDNQINESPWIKENVELLLEDIPMKDLELFEIQWDGVFKREFKEESNPVPEPPAVPKSKLGEIYQLGDHRIMCGDSTKDLDKLMNGKVVDLVFSDPPYGLNFQSNGRVKTPKFDVLENDDSIHGEFITQCLKHSKGWFLICTSWKVVSQWIAVSSTIGPLSNMIIWNKGGGGIGDLKNTLATDYEIILAYNRGNPIPSKRIGSVWSFNKDSGNDYQHPTQKPVDLPRNAILFLSKGDVLDPFLGSGSTLIACEQTGRSCYGMELEPAYMDVIIERWENYTGEKAKLV